MDGGREGKGSVRSWACVVACRVVWRRGEREGEGGNVLVYFPAFSRRLCLRCSVDE